MVWTAEIQRSKVESVNRTRWYILAGFIVVFSSLTAWAMFNQSPGDIRDNRNITATLLTVSGPFTGAIARSGQSCCLKFSFSLFPYCATILAGGIVLQLCPLPFRNGASIVRTIAWILGLLGWFGGAVLSLLHALG